MISVLCVHGDNLPSRIIEVGERGKVSHIAVTDGDWVIEALGTGVHAVPFERYGRSGVRSIPLHLTDDQSVALWRWLRAQTWPPRPYNFLQIGGDALTLLTHHPHVAPGHGCVCSELLALGLATVGVAPWAPAPPETIDPQQVEDWAVTQDTKPVETVA